MMHPKLNFEVWNHIVSSVLSDKGHMAETICTDIVFSSKSHQRNCSQITSRQLNGKMHGKSKMDQKVNIYYYKWSCVFIFQSFSYCLKGMNRLFSPVLNVFQMKIEDSKKPKWIYIIFIIQTKWIYISLSFNYNNILYISDFIPHKCATLFNCTTTFSRPFIVIPLKP